MSCTGVLAWHLCFFAYDVEGCDLRYLLLGGLCKEVGMRVSTFKKTESVAPSRKRVDCLLWVGSELLP